MSLQTVPPRQRQAIAVLALAGSMLLAGCVLPDYQKVDARSVGGAGDSKVLADILSTGAGDRQQNETQDTGIIEVRSDVATSDLRPPVGPMDPPVEGSVDGAPPADGPAREVAAEGIPEPAVEPAPERQLAVEPIAEPGPTLLPEPRPEPAPDSGVDAPVVPPDMEPEVPSLPTDAASDVAASPGTSSLSVVKSGTGGGTITSSPVGINCGGTCTARFTSGTVVTLTAAVDETSTFTGWSGACSGMGPCAVTLDRAQVATASFEVVRHSITVSKAGTGGGSVTSSPGGIACGGTCSATFVAASLVTLTAIADGTSTFTGWSGACAGTDPCAVNVDGAKSVTANFDVIQFALSVSKTGAGGGNITSSPTGIACGTTCTASFVSGTQVTLTPAADGTSTFTGWSGACSGSATCTVTMDEARSATANFEVVQNGINVAKTGTGGGIVTSAPAGIDCGSTCSHSFTPDTSVTLTAVADGTSTFTGWSGSCSGVGTCSVTADAAKSVTANFDVIKFGLTVATSGTGGGTVTSVPAGIDCGSTCSVDLTTGAVVTLTAVADGTSTFTGWSGSCSDVGTCSVTADAAKSVTANFDLVQFGLTVATSGTGSGTVTSAPAGIDCGSRCSYSFTTGTSVTLNAVPDGMSTFRGWSGACGGIGTCTVTADAAKSVTANFDLIQFELTASKTGTGGGTVTSTPAGITCGSTCTASFNIGTVVTFSASAAEGSTFTGWSGSCSGTGECSVTADAAKSVTAEFMKAAGTACEEGTECASGNCLDRVCCTPSSCPQCRNCGSDGTCSVIIASRADTTGATCNGTFTCDATAACTCATGYAGTSCDQCASGYVGYPTCVDDLCQPDPCNGHSSSCNPTTGACTCAAGYDGSSCDRCASGFISYPTCVDDPCQPDPCNGHASSCNSSTGECVCGAGFAAPHCDTCTDGYAGYPSCQPCGGSSQACCPTGSECATGLGCASGTCKPIRWAQVFPQNPQPATRAYHCATERNASRHWIFGGTNDSTFYKDTWQWIYQGYWYQTGATSPPPVPPNLVFCAMATMPTTEFAILYGGAIDGGLPSTEAWLENGGTNWGKMCIGTNCWTTNGSPPPLAGHAMVATSDRIVLFGGETSGNLLTNGTYELTYVASPLSFTWTTKSPSTSPSARSRHSMAYDSNRHVVVMFGGGNAETWEWDGNNWAQKVPASSPSARDTAAMAYDAKRRVVVLFGGYNCGADPCSDTWEWDGTNWYDATARSGTPGMRSGHSMSYSSSPTSTIRLFGGRQSGFGYLNDTWELKAQ
jgi:hypothetical protein